MLLHCQSLGLARGTRLENQEETIRKSSRWRLGSDCQMGQFKWFCFVDPLSNRDPLKHVRGFRLSASLRKPITRSSSNKPAYQTNLRLLQTIINLSTTFPAALGWGHTLFGFCLKTKALGGLLCVSLFLRVPSLCVLRFHAQSAQRPVRWIDPATPSFFSSSPPNHAKSGKSPACHCSSGRPAPARGAFGRP